MELPSKRLRTKPAAEYCGESEAALAKRRLNGSGPPYIKLGRTVVYDTRDLDDWLAAHRRRSTSDPARGDLR
jgi:hypothetical protein